MSFEDEYGDGWEYHQAPLCPWCGSTKTWAEFGMYDAFFPAQLSPFACNDCGALELWNDSDALVADDAEREVNWFRGPTWEPPTGIVPPPSLWEPLSTTDFMAEATRFAGLPTKFRGDTL